MLQYPMTFRAKAFASPGVMSKWTTGAAHLDDELPGAVPPEFLGPGGGFSPEDFYALAIVNCYIATFKVFAEKSNFSFESVEGHVDLEVDRDEKGLPWMARAHLKIHLRRPQSREMAAHLLEKAYKGCLVMNSIKTEKKFEYELTE